MSRIRRWRKRKPSSPASCGAFVRISPLRTRAASRGVIWVLGRERLNGTAVEDLAFDSAPLKHAPFGRLELVQAGRDDRLQWAERPPRRLLPGHRHHLLEEEGLPPLARAIRARSSPEMRSGISSSASSSGRGSSGTVTGQLARRSRFRS